MTDAGFGEAELEMEQHPFVSTDPEDPSISTVTIQKSAVCSTALWSCVAYSLFSIGMTLVNKVILTTYKFEYHMVLLLYQNGACVVLLLIARWLGLAKFEQVETDKLISWIPLNILFIMMLLTGFYSLNLLTVPMATIFKNSTNVLITMGDFFFYRRAVSRGIVMSLLLMLTGAILAGSSDLEFNLTGYLWAILNCFVTAAYVLYMPRAIADSKLNAFGRVYYNNLLSLPLVTLVDLLVYQDIQKVLFNTDNTGGFKENIGFVIVVLFSGCIGFFLSLSSFQCVHATSPTTYSMVGSVNKVPLAIFGVIIFKSQISLQSASFMMLSLLAGVMYAYTKATERK